MSTGQHSTSTTLRDIQLLAEQINKRVESTPSNRSQITTSCTTPEDTNVSSNVQQVQVQDSILVAQNFQSIASSSAAMPVREATDNTVRHDMQPVSDASAPSSSVQPDLGGTSTGGYTQHGVRILNQTRVSSLTPVQLNDSTSTPPSAQSQSMSELFHRKRNRAENQSEETQVEPAESEQAQPAKKPRYGTRFNWPAIPERVFKSKEECTQFIEAEQTWTHVRDRSTNNGMRGKYRCNGVKARGENCLANIQTRFDQVPGVVRYELYRLNAAHDHLNSANKVKKLSDEAKEIISNLVDDGKTLLRIFDHLKRQNDVGDIDKKQVGSFIKTYRKG